MAIDWTNVEGYREDMTAEEKLSLLENKSEESASQRTQTPEAPVAEPEETKKVPAKPGANYVLKAQYDKLASEHAALKKQHRATMSEEEQKEADRQAAHEAMQAELDELRREKQVTGYRAAYLSMGYDESLAAETAEAMAAGDTDLVFANMKKHNVALEKQLRAQLLKETPRTPPGEDPDKKKEQQNALRKSMGL